MTATTVSSGQTSSGLTLGAGDTLTVANGGTVIGLTVTPGGAATVSGGGTIGGAIVDDGSIDLLTGVALTGLSVGGGGFGSLLVHSGASFGSSIVDTGAIVLEPGFSGSDLRFSGGGAVFVASGAANRAATLDGFTQVVSGLTSGTVVENGGLEEVDSGGLSFGAVLTGSGGEQDAAGGVAVGTVARSGTSTTAYNGGVFVGAIVQGGAIEEVDDGTTSGTVLSGGTQMVDGGVASGTVVVSGGSLEVSSGSSVSAVLGAGGTEAVYAGGVATGTILSGGTVVIHGGALEMAASIAAPDAGSVVFEDGGVLVIDGTVAPAAMISGFTSSGAAIDLTGIGGPLGSSLYAIVGGDQVTFSGTAGTLTLSIEDAASRAFLIGDDGRGGLLVTTEPTPPPTIALAPASDTGILGDGVTSIAAPIVTGSGAPTASIMVFDGTTPVGSAAVGGNGFWLASVTALTNGLHDLVAVETTRSGPPISSTALALTIDTAAPPSPTGLALAPTSDSGRPGGTFTNVTRPTITGSGRPGDTIALYDGQNVFGTGTVQPDGTWSVATTAVLGDGVQTFTATDTSPAGNVSARSTALRVTIDTAAPAAPAQPGLAAGSDTGALGDDITNATRPVITGWGEYNDTITLRDGQAVIGSGTVAWGGAWSVTPITLLSDGLHSITAQATDPAGNMSPISLALVLRIDSSVPSAPASVQLAPASDSGIVGDGITNNPIPAFTGTGTMGDSVILYDGGTSIGSAIVGQNNSWSLTPTTVLAEGVHPITARQMNAAGTQSAPSAELTLTIDMLPPAAPTFVPIGDTTAPDKPAFAGNAPDSREVLVFDGRTSLGSAIVGSNGAWPWAFTAPLAAGSHVLTAKAEDAAGNLSPSSAPLVATVAADRSYQIASAPDHDGNVATRSYNAQGQLIETDTTNSQGRLLRAVSETTAILNIYDAAGTLIGIVSQPSSSASAAPAFTTAGGPGGATTSSGPAASQITLAAGNQVLSSQGSDTITAGAGNDTIYASGPSVSIIGGSGRLTLIAGVTASTLAGGSGPVIVFGGSGGGSFQGGRAGGNVLAAGSGNTTLLGGGAGDVLVAGTGRTTIKLQGGGVAFGNTGQTTFYNAAGGLVVGGSGAATMIAGTGPEALFAGSGDTTMTGGIGQAIMAGSDRGRTVMTGGTGSTQFVGYGGQVTATGGGGNDTFFTGSGPMQIREGPGYAQVVFGAGSATIAGGSGVDHYVFVNGAAGGADVISGFKVGTDQINLYGYDRGRMHTSVLGGGVAIGLPDGTEITLVGVTRLAPTSIA